MALHCKKIKESSDNVVETKSGTEAAINALNDDCLIYIFNFLECLHDFNATERVCKRWKRVITSRMVWNNIARIYEEDAENLDEILEACGHRIISLHVESDVLHVGNDIMNHINKYCKKLKHLKISFPGFFKLMNFDVVKFPFLNNLKSFSLHDFLNKFDFDEYLERIIYFLVRARNLTSFSISDGNNGQIIIEDNGKNIEIGNFITEKKIDLDRLFHRFPGTKDFKIYFEDLKRDNDFSLHPSLYRISNQITFLYFNGINNHNCFKGRGFKKLNFNKLKKLVIINSYHVTDHVLFSFVKSSPSLKEIKFCGNNSLTSDGYRQLAMSIKLIKIKLNLDWGSRVTEGDIKYLARSCSKLQEIYCPKTLQLSPEDIKSIFDSSPNLQFIEVNGRKNLRK